MGLPGDNITTWAQMQKAFNNKYRDYCRSKDTKEEIIRMCYVPIPIGVIIFEWMRSKL